jgi:short-subunit dehydrogenase
MAAGDYSAERAARSMSVNYNGIATSLDALLPAMIARRGGHVALVASVAGYRGLPKAAAYAPTKAAVISLAEVLRLELAPHQVRVTLVNPGFVATPMTAVNTFPMPFLLSPDDAARRIVRGLASGRFEVAFPWQLVTGLKFLRVLPYWAYFRIASTMMRRR